MARRVRAALAGMRWLYVRSVKPGSECPRYSASALTVSPASSSTEAYACRSACIPWIAQTGKVNPGTLGKSKNYTHKMEFHCKPEVLDWLKQYEIKPTNEPGRYAVPADKIDEFNKYADKTTVQPLDSGNTRRRRR